MKWFGEPWPADWQENGRAPICSNEADHVPIPTGVGCVFCPNSIQPGDQGVWLGHIGGPGYEGPAAHPVHIECLMENTVGPNWRALLKDPLTNKGNNDG